jgi:glycopeptide antibiotics resistance protein
MLGNIAAFVPLGLLLPLAFKLRWPIVTVGLVALALSVGIELGQATISEWLGYAYRSTDIDDVILNVLGALVGATAFVLFSFARAGRAEPTT